MSGILKVEYDRHMISLRAAGGISAGEMYKLKIWKASSSNDDRSQSCCQFGGKGGISSGMNSPLSGARSRRTVSSKESCLWLVVDSLCLHMVDGYGR